LFADSSSDIFMKYFQKAEDLKQQGISYNLSATTNDNKSIYATIYMKGDKIRMDAAEGATIIDIAKSEMYIFSEKDKTAIKMMLNMEQVKQATLDISQEKAKELVYLKEDTRNGYACKVFKAKDGNKGVEYYMTNEYGFPTYVKEENIESTITDFKTNPIKDSLFVLPEDISVIDMGNITALAEEFTQQLSEEKVDIGDKVNDYLKNSVNDAVVRDMKESVREFYSEQKSKLKKETKEKTKGKTKK